MTNLKQLQNCSFIVSVSLKQQTYFFHVGHILTRILWKSTKIYFWPPIQNQT